MKETSSSSLSIEYQNNYQIVLNEFITWRNHRESYTKYVLLKIKNINYNNINNKFDIDNDIIMKSIEYFEEEGDKDNDMFIPEKEISSKKVVTYALMLITIRHDKMNSIIIERINGYLDHFYDLLSLSSSSLSSLSTTVTTTLSLLQRKLLVNIQLILPILNDSNILIFSLQLTQSIIKFISIYKTSSTSSSTSSSSSILSLLTDNIRILLTINAYVLTHHYHKIFSEIKIKDTEELQNLLVMIFCDPQIVHEDFIIITSLVMGLRLYVYPRLADFIRLHTIDDRSKFESSIEKLSIDRLTSNSNTIDLKINSSFFFFLSNFDLYSILRKRYGIRIKSIHNDNDCNNDNDQQKFLRNMNSLESKEMIRSFNHYVLRNNTINCTRNFKYCSLIISFI